MKTRRGSYESPQSPSAPSNESPPAVNGRRSPKAIEEDIDGMMSKLKTNIEERNQLASRDGEVDEVEDTWYSDLIASYYSKLSALFKEQIKILESEGNHVSTPRPASVPPRSPLSSERLDTAILKLYDLYKKNKPTRRKSRGAEASVAREHSISTLYQLRFLIGERIRVYEAEENERRRQARDDEIARRHSGAGGGGVLFGDVARHTSAQYNGGGGLFGSSPSTASSFAGRPAPNQSGFPSFGSAASGGVGTNSGIPFVPFRTQQGAVPSSIVPPTGFGGGHSSGFSFGNPSSDRVATGTREVPYEPTIEHDGTTGSTRTLESITATPHYERTGKSFEELRFEDYMQGNRGSGGVQARGIAPFGASATAFGSTGAASNPFFFGAFRSALPGASDSRRYGSPDSTQAVAGSIADGSNTRTPDSDQAVTGSPVEPSMSAATPRSGNTRAAKRRSQSARK